MRIDRKSLALPADPGKGDAAYAALVASREDVAALGEDARALIVAMAGNSPYLARLIERHPVLAADLLRMAPEDCLKTACAPLNSARADIPPVEPLMRLMRVAKEQVALITAAADIAGAWTLQQVTRALSDFADLALSLALARLVHDRIEAGDLAPTPGHAPRPSLAVLEKSGLFLLGMGKLGAHELNYSSDIDLIALYDEEIARPAGRRPLSETMIRIVRDLVRIIESRTADGYVFRTDLRLRPDPGATAVALSVGAAETYYQSVALNWERAAMIKARVVAGDLEAGADYLARLSPFVWRRTLDYAAIEDIHAIKDQIHRHHGHKGILLPGFDVKLGPGGIREIEFHAQINQLIAGGREPDLRVRGTLEALARLVACGRVDPSVRDDLGAAYVFLRTVEHRLQMIADAQIHSLPADESGLRHVALFCGFRDLDAFRDTLIGHLNRVQGHYDRLLPGDFGRRESLSPEEIETLLSEKGYASVENALAIVERWRRGRYRAMRTARARRLFEATLGPLLRAFAEMADPDKALARFDAFLAQLPQGVQLFALFQANPALFRLIGRIMGVAPALAGMLAKRPQLLDSVLDPDFFAPLPDIDSLRADLDRMLATARDYEDILDLARRWTNDIRFRLGVQALEGLADDRELSQAMTRLADVVVSRLLEEASAQYSKRHGPFPGGALAVVAMGKYGGCELSFGSDLDLVLLYEVRDPSSMSEGPRPLAPSRWFSGLGQAFITAITALMPEGRLFEVDTRLRPSGAAGPLVVTIETFAGYYREAAWTWEHMALTRARVVAAPRQMADRLRGVIADTLARGHDHGALLPAVADMRQRLAREFATDNPWNVKHVRGGMIDMEFIVQYLLLREGSSHRDIFTPRLDDCISRLAAIGALREEEAERLIAAHGLFHMIQAMLRLSLGTETDEALFSDGLKAALVHAAGMPDFAALRGRLHDALSDVRAIYSRIIDEPFTAMQEQQKGDMP